jgi:glycosyltransferase involved in cell wall biosynthesis
MIQFSVVIAVYNKEQYLAQTLASVLAQTHRDFELLVINDGSTDGSEAVINGFLTDSRITSNFQENQGVSAARNAGIAQATNPYIALLDADDVWMPNHLETLAQLIQKYPEQKVYATNSKIIDAGKTYHKTYSIAAKNGVHIVNFFKASCIDSIVNSSTICFHKSVIKKSGEYNTNIKSGEDTDFFIRLGTHFAIVFSYQITVRITRTKSSLSHQKIPLQQRLPLNNYLELEANNKDAKKFIDLNRFAYCIEEKLYNNKNNATQLMAQIDFNNLNKKQQILLRMPVFGLKIATKLKRVLRRFGLSLSAFN